jgi:hypothetical protein
MQDAVRMQLPACKICSLYYGLEHVTHMSYCSTVVQIISLDPGIDIDTAFPYIRFSPFSNNVRRLVSDLFLPLPKSEKPDAATFRVDFMPRYTSSMTALMTLTTNLVEHKLIALSFDASADDAKATREPSTMEGGR